MANVKISDLGVVPSPLTGTEELPLVQAGSTYKATPQDIAAYVNSSAVQNGLATPQIIADDLVNRPVSTFIGTLFIDTIIGNIYRYNGSNWDLISYRPNYLVYTALLTQTGVLAPTENILDNTLGNVIWGRDDAGNYVANSSGLFTPSKTVVFANQASGVVSGIFCGGYDVNTINLSTYNPTDLVAQDYNGVIQIEIRVYN